MRFMVGYHCGYRLKELRHSGNPSRFRFSSQELVLHEFWPVQWKFERLHRKIRQISFSFDQMQGSYAGLGTVARICVLVDWIEFSVSSLCQPARLGQVILLSPSSHLQVLLLLILPPPPNFSFPFCRIVLTRYLYLQKVQICHTSLPSRRLRATSSINMAATRTIPQAEWDLYKTRLRSLYDKEPLAKVIQLAESDYGFLARFVISIHEGWPCSNYHTSKAQYIRQFKKWGFEKNLKSEQWKGIAGMVRKRKSQGKDSQVSIKNRQIPHKKLCKEMSRYALPADNHEHTCKTI